MPMLNDKEKNLKYINMNISVLLIDDQDFIGKMIKNMLESEDDIEFHFCNNAKMAVNIANNILPTIILQDLTMPDVDGFEMVQIYRLNKYTQKTPVIVLSGHEDARIKAKAFSLGVNDYIVKPPDKIELIARIRHHSKSYIHRLQRDEAYQRVAEQRSELEVKNRFIKKTFGRYLSDDIVSSILETPDGLELGGEKRKISILMSDLRGFTSMSERLNPEDVLSIINMYLETMTDIIMKYNGTIDEFIGDAILVIFGAPVSNEDDTARALACALEMQLAMECVNENNIKNGFPEVEMGIGINTGEVIVGNIGSIKRSKYGVIGSQVNLTSRIESYTIGGQILVSQSTIDKNTDIIRIDDTLEIKPKGVKKPIKIYDIGGIGGKYNIYLPEKKDIEWIKLNKPLNIKFTILEGKHMGNDFYNGIVSLMTTKMLNITTDAVAEKLTNIKISLLDENGSEISADIYGKIIDVSKDVNNCLIVNLTSVPPNVIGVFEKVIQNSA